MDENEWNEKIFATCIYYTKENRNYFHCTHPARLGGPCKFEICPRKKLYRPIDKNQTLLTAFLIKS
ncbi:MAG TPA: hypothetical protein VMV49_06170 [Candidatus Deferrimicrobium sp.]|nr:hypothetical protein [Candidatus Deferrimicrobium sp.]